MPSNVGKNILKSKYQTMSTQEALGLYLMNLSQDSAFNKFDVSPSRLTLIEEALGSKNTTGDQAVFKGPNEKSGENTKMSFGLLKRIRDDMSEKKSTVDERLDRAFEFRRET